jgi:hypothetical protein
MPTEKKAILLKCVGNIQSWNLKWPPLVNHISLNYHVSSRSQSPRGLRRVYATNRLLGSWVGMPPGACKSVCSECCVLSCKGLCVGLIIRPEESYQVWYVWVWSTSLDNEEALGHEGCRAMKKGHIYACKPLSPRNLLHFFLLLVAVR